MKKVNPQKMHILDSNSISKIFNDFLTDQNTNKVYKNKIDTSIYSLIKTNKIIWEQEDIARINGSEMKNIVQAKKTIDKNNQMRNNLIKEIDKKITQQLKGQIDYTSKFYSESPGMIIDRLSIIFIKLSEIQIIIQVIKEKDLKKEYRDKEKILMRQIQSLLNFLDVYFVELKNKKVYFDIQDAVKIYNDERVKKYIKKLSKK